MVRYTSLPLAISILVYFAAPHLRTGRRTALVALINYSRAPVRFSLRFNSRPIPGRRCHTTVYCLCLDFRTPHTLRLHSTTLAGDAALAFLILTSVPGRSAPFSCALMMYTQCTREKLVLQLHTPLPPGRSFAFSWLRLRTWSCLDAMPQRSHTPRNGRLPFYATRTAMVCSPFVLLPVVLPGERNLIVELPRTLCAPG